MYIYVYYTVYICVWKVFYVESVKGLKVCKIDLLNILNCVHFSLIMEVTIQRMSNVSMEFLRMLLFLEHANFDFVVGYPRLSQMICEFVTSLVTGFEKIWLFLLLAYRSYQLLNVFLLFLIFCQYHRGPTPPKFP